MDGPESKTKMYANPVYEILVPIGDIFRGSGCCELRSEIMYRDLKTFNYNSAKRFHKTSLVLRFRKLRPRTRSGAIRSCNIVQTLLKDVLPEKEMRFPTQVTLTNSQSATYTFDRIDFSHVGHP